MNKMSLILLLLCLPIRVWSQKKHAVVTYAANKFKVQVYNSSWDKENDIVVNIEQLEGSPTAENYHTTGALRSTYITSDGSKMYFSLYHLPVESATDSIKWTALFMYEFATRKISRILELPLTMYVPWELNEARNTILLYDYNEGWIKEMNLKSMKSKQLFPATLHSGNYQLISDSSSCSFIYVYRDSIYKTDYHFLTEQSKSNVLFNYPDYSGYRNGNLLVYSLPGKGNLTYLITPQRRHIKSIPRTNDYAAWKDDNHLYITEENALCLYNLKLEMVKSFYVEKPFVMQTLENELLIAYTKNKERRFAIVDSNLTTLTELPEVYDNFIQLITTFTQP